MKQRPILVAVIGYIIGILWGLYFRFSIVLFYILILTTYYIIKKILKYDRKPKFKLLSFHRYKRYLKLIIDSKVIFLLIISSIISNEIVLVQNKIYDSLYQDGESIEMIGIIVSQRTEKQYYDLYQVKILNSNHLKIYIQVNKNSEKLEYGDKVKLQGEYRKPSSKRNYGGYHDEQYLKTLKICGRMKVTQIEVIEKEQLNMFFQFFNQINLKIKEELEMTFDEEKAAILKGLLLGENTEMQEEVKESFQISNISHILAISGMHISYIIIGIQLSITKVAGKRKTRIFTIVSLIGYTYIIGFSPSIIRAVSMGIITIGGEIFYRKSDEWNSIAISLLGILLYNPFLILNMGVQLSYLGTIGIILFSPKVLQIFNKIKVKKKFGFIEKLKEILSVTLSAQIMILPIMLYHFNMVGIYFCITNLLVSIIIGPMIMLGFLYSVFALFFCFVSKFFILPLNMALEFLSLISQFSELPFAKIYLPTPSVISIILYYIGILFGSQIYFIYNSNYLRATYKRVKNLIALFQYKFHQKRKNYLFYILIVVIIFVFIHVVPKDLKIYFMDVGQGDCTFIVTPQNKTILIDGGGSLIDEFDVGKKTVIPYLLDRGYTTIDYMLISHFDQDHLRSDC